MSLLAKCVWVGGQSGPLPDSSALMGINCYKPDPVHWAWRWMVSALPLPGSQGVRGVGMASPGLCRASVKAHHQTVQWRWHPSTTLKSSGEQSIPLALTCDWWEDLHNPELSSCLKYRASTDMNFTDGNYLTWQDGSSGSGHLCVFRPYPSTNGCS